MRFVTPAARVDQIRRSVVPSGVVARPPAARFAPTRRVVRVMTSAAASEGSKGRKKKKKGVEQSTKIPNIVPHSKCRLRLMREERVKDYLLMEEEFIKNQERLKPIDESRQREMLEIDKLRGMPLKVGDLEEIIDDDHAIVAPHSGLEYYAPIVSIVDKD